MDQGDLRRLLSEVERCGVQQTVEAHHRVFQGGLLRELRALLRTELIDPDVDSVVPLYESLKLKRYFFSIDPWWVEEAIQEFTRPGDWIINPFCGSGTVPIIASLLKRSCVGYEVNPEYRKVAEENIDRMWRMADERGLDRGFITMRDHNAGDMAGLSVCGPRLVLFGPPEVSSSSMAATFWKSIQSVFSGTTIGHVVMFYGIRNMDTSTFDNWMEGAKPLFWPLDMRMRLIHDQDGTPLHEFRVVFRPDHVAGHPTAKYTRWPKEE